MDKKGGNTKTTAVLNQTVKGCADMMQNGNKCCGGSMKGVKDMPGCCGNKGC